MPISRLLRGLFVGLLGVSAAAPVHARQAPEPGGRAVPAPGQTLGRLAPGSPTRLAVELPSLPGGGTAFLASAIVPGGGQYLLGQDRWVAYGAVEVWSWVSWLQQRNSGRTLAERYRDLAWQVARRISTGERRDTVFEYYEALAYYAASGAFDLEPGSPGVQPEVERGTFNGELWALARALHGGESAVPGTPGHARALEYYMARAIPPGYAWVWGASNLEQQVFVDLIAESDAAFRSASRYLGLILANHLASAVDALVTARLRQLGSDALRIQSAPVRGPGGVRWEYSIRVTF
jgi:hypothetical protein